MCIQYCGTNYISLMCSLKQDSSCSSTGCKVTGITSKPQGQAEQQAHNLINETKVSEISMVLIPLFWSQSWSEPRSHEVLVSVSYALVSWSQIDLVFLKCNDF